MAFGAPDAGIQAQTKTRTFLSCLAWRAAWDKYTIVAIALGQLTAAVCAYHDDSISNIAADFSCVCMWA